MLSLWLGTLNWALGDGATWSETIHPRTISKGEKVMGVPSRITGDSKETRDLTVTHSICVMDVCQTNELVGQGEPAGGPGSCAGEGSLSRERASSWVGGGAEAWSLAQARSPGDAPFTAKVL